MSEEVEVIEADQDEKHGLDSMVEKEEQHSQEQQKKQAEDDEKSKHPSPEELERATRLARRINAGFLFGVDNAVCPSVDVYSVVDSEVGDEAFIPLALAFDGDIPDWLKEMVEQWMPYAGAGWYMYKAISGARRAELEARAQAEIAKKAATQEAMNHGQA